MTAQHEHVEYGTVYTYDEYRKLEESSLERHEYHGGRIYLMSGGTSAHSRIKVNLIAELERQVRGPCVVYDADMLVRQSERDASYPDASVTCDERDQEPDLQEIASPRLVVEVLSSSTVAYDLTTKLDLWQGMPSLEAILYIDSRAWCPAWLWLRGPGGDWRESRPDELIDIVPLDLKLDLADLYRGSGRERQ